MCKRLSNLAIPSFLALRYSEPLKALITLPDEMVNMEKISTANDGDKTNLRQPSSYKVPIQMGCHGVGVSRMIGVIAETLSDEKGLNWPRAIAPYEVVIIPIRGHESDAIEVYDTLVWKSISL